MEEFIIITGMSGAGKSKAINALEDIGYFCVDNVPPSLLPSFADLLKRGLPRIAVVTDIRGGELFNDIMQVLDSLSMQRVDYKLLFLDATDEVISRRYKETRRRHPLCEDGKVSITDALKAERERLRGVRARSNYIIDTSLNSVAQLKSRINNIFLSNIGNAMNIQCVSFGFKYGSVADADLIFDVRCLPNPFYENSLRHLTGLDEGVREFVMDSEQTKGFVQRLLSLIDYMVPLYISEGKNELVIAIGCTGGKHRSVVLTEFLYNYLVKSGCRASISHRDVTKS